MEKGGAPVGNRNAVKHGLYSKFVTKAEKREIEKVKGVEGLDDELALLRVKLGHLLKNNPDRIDLHIKTLNMIDRMVRTRHSLNPEDMQGYQDAITKIITEVGIPLGLKVIP